MEFLDDYLNYIHDKGNDALADSIEKTATEIDDQYLSKFDYRGTMTGLLFGNIQSGKTGQTFGVLSMAADRGFHYFLLLTTDNTSLKQQTYDRALKDLKDFCVVNEDEEQKFLSNDNQKPVLIVVKKNVSKLRSWLDRFSHYDALAGNTLFIIDDEADAASLDTKVNGKSNQRSSINNALEKIRMSAQSSIYLQVTGTPQSLILQSKNSKFRPSFTYYFKPGREYLGGNYFFPRQPDKPKFIRIVDGMTDNDIPDSVFIRHLVVSAQAMLSGDVVSNCLIHPGVRKNSHRNSENEITQSAARIGMDFEQPHYQEIVEKEYALMNPTKSEKLPLETIKDEVRKILHDRKYKIVILNSSSDDTSSDYETGCNFIIGGMTLSRGVTFGKLNTYYYTRTSKAPQADTMWQHNRIFGYDRDKGLISIFITQNLYQLFVSINETNNGIIENVRTGHYPVISYTDGLKPTRSNVLNKSLLDILVGGSAHYPNDPISNYENVNHVISGYNAESAAKTIGLAQIAHILKMFRAEPAFNLDGYIDLINSKKIQLPANAKIFVIRDRHVNKDTGALLSDKDWKYVSSFSGEFVLTLFEVDNTSVQKPWSSEDKAFVPHLKLPVGSNIYII